MKKKLMSVILAAAVIAVSLCGCAKEAEPVSVNVGSLNGPTSMGLVNFIAKAEASETANQFNFEIMTAADELTAKVAGGQVDIALLPANAASAVYNKTEGGIKVLDICVLGPLCVISGKDNQITSINELEGKTVYMTGKGTTPEYVMSYILAENNVKNVTLEYKSEPQEVASVLAKDSDAIGMLPQPFATAAIAQNNDLAVYLDMTEEWNKVNDKGQFVTGVAVVRTDFLEENEAAVMEFMKEHEISVNGVNEDPEAASVLVAQKGIVAKASLAAKAIPYCSLCYIAGDEMKTAVAGYLEVLFAQNPKSVGGKVPGEDFYY